MDGIREKMKAFVGKRMKVRGTLFGFGEWTFNYRDIGRACIAHPQIAGEVMADHVWVLGTKRWCEHKGAIGKQVEFNATVGIYDDKKRGSTNYHLIHPDDLQVIHDPPALRIPDPPADEVISLVQENVTMIDKTPIDQDALEILRQVKTFTKAVGGQDQALNVMRALEEVAIPLPDLIAWIKELAA